MTGSQFYSYVQNMTDAQREQAIVDEIATGNVPDFIRDLVPVTATATIGGVSRTATYFVTPQYMAVGSDADFFRMPMSAPLAQQIADICDANLPTRKMVNDIYAQSTVKVAPYPYSPATYDIDSINTMWLSNETIDGQLAGQPLTALVGGTKKDVVVTPEIDNRPSPARVAIYGWHQLNGSPIQPLSLVHESTYEDYSHGIRLVEKAMLLDGADTTVAAVIGSSTLNVLLTDEGANTRTTYPVPSPYPLPNENPNLVNNWSLEGTYVNGAAPGWTTWTAAGSNVITFGRASLNKHEGTYSQYWSRGNTAVFDGGAYQTVAVEAGATYEITAWMKRQSSFAGTSMRFGYDLTGGTNATAGSVAYTDITGATDNVWVQYTASAVATGTSLTVFARGGHTGTTGDTDAYFYLDEVVVRKTADPVAQPYEHITNGGFEATFVNGVCPGWSSWTAAGSGTITFGRASVNKYAGSYSQYWNRADTAAFDGGVYQTVSVTPGKTYAISGWMKRQSTLAGTSMKIGYDLSGGTSGTAASVVYTDITGGTDNVWVPYTANATATGSTMTIFLRGGHTGTTGGTNSYFYVDAISVFGE